MRFAHRLMLAAMMLASVMSFGASAQTYPDKPVRVIVPNPPGTGVDAVMRMVAERLSKMWNQPVLIDNRPGGNGFIAMTAVKRSPADGYTLAQVDESNVAVVPNVFPKTVPFDPRKDFEPIGPVFRAYWFLTLPGDSNAKSVPDVVAEIKSRQGAFNYGSYGMGSLMHLQGAMFERATGSRMTHVPYKDITQALGDLHRHQLGLVFTTGGTGGPLVKANKLKFLAAVSPQRHPAYPDVPTLAELGGPAELNFQTWVGLIAPRGVPKPVVDKINADVNRVLAEPEVRERLISMGFEAWAAPTSGLERQIEVDLKKYGELAKQLNLSLD